MSTQKWNDVPKVVPNKAEPVKVPLHEAVQNPSLVTPKTNKQPLPEPTRVPLERK